MEWIKSSTSGTILRYCDMSTERIVGEVFSGTDGIHFASCGNIAFGQFLSLQAAQLAVQDHYANEVIYELVGRSSQSAIAKQIQQLRELKPGWDSYRAKPITEAALRMAEAIMGTTATSVPTADGGIQLEWHTAGVEAIIDINPDGTINYGDS
jgi:hypothetical protein